MGSNLSELNGVIDDDPNKPGMYYLGLPSPIVHSTDVGSLRDVNIVLTAVNNARDILPKLFQLGPRNVIVPSFSC